MPRKKRIRAVHYPANMQPRELGRVVKLHPWLKEIRLGDLVRLLKERARWHA